MKVVILLLMIQFTTAYRINTPRKQSRARNRIDLGSDSHKQQYKIKRVKLTSPMEFMSTLDRILAEAEHKAEIK